MEKLLINQVTSEIAHVLEAVREDDIASIARSVLSARRTVVHGAGRVGLACKGFAMRLGHLGMTAYTVTDSTTPSIGDGDLLILASSSGETQTVYDVGVLGRKLGTRLIVVTAVPESRIAKLSDFVVVLNAPSKFGAREGMTSIQPMATLFEQCLQIVFDVTILALMKMTNQTHDDMWARHSNLD